MMNMELTTTITTTTIPTIKSKLEPNRDIQSQGSTKAQSGPQWTDGSYLF